MALRTREGASLWKWGWLIFLSGVLALTLSSCDEGQSFVEPSDMVFSVFGYLDPGADTQWVRVSPLRTTTLTSQDAPDAVVTIEDLGTGRSIEMRHSVYSQISGEFDERRYAHNYMTTEAIEPRATYRLTVRRSDGKSSTSVVQTPSSLHEFPVTVGIPQAGAGVTSYSVRFPIEPSDHLAMVSLLYDPPDRLVIGGAETTECRNLGISSVYIPLSGSYDTSSGYYFLSFGRSVQFPIDFPCTERGEWSVRIVRTVEEWPFDASASNLSLSGYSNIESGIGFLGGLVTRRVPLEPCELTGPGRPEVCQLHYGPGSATLTIRPANGFEYDPTFLPNATVKRMDESWSRTSIRLPLWNAESEILYFPGLLPGTVRVRLMHGTRCEDRILTLLPDVDRWEQIEMGPPAPGEMPNADGCRERVQ